MSLKFWMSLSLVLVIGVGLSSTLAAQESDSKKQEETEEKVYSGPQVGEKLPGFTMKGAFGDSEGKEIDLVKSADGKPMVIIFVHQRTRPAFALTNVLLNYCNDQKGKLTRGVCFLTADPTETQTWLSRIKNYFPRGVPIGISHDGAEGPGAYGLNRNVSLTVLVGNKGKTTANFALVQPSIQADGPKMLKAIAAAIGAKKEPDLNKYLARRGGIRGVRLPRELGKLVRQLYEKDVSQEKIDETVKAVEAMIKDKRNWQNLLGRFAQFQLQGDRMKSIAKGSKAQLEKWARQYGPKNRPRRNADAKLTGMLRSLIQKTNSDEQVDKIAKSIEEYVAKNQKAKSEIARISKTIAGSDRLTNYGTARCQEVLKKWAKKYNNQQETDKQDKEKDKQDK